MSDIEYEGPGDDYRPGVGGNFGNTKADMFRAPSEQTYANLPVLKERLRQLIQGVDRLIDEIEMELNQRALPLSLSDTRLREAHVTEWPTDLGEPKNYISYRYYKALKNRNSTTASYIRQRFEEAGRDVTGTTGVDVISLVHVVRDEALLVQEFLTTYVGSVNDSSEYRTLELFQDWVENAFYHAGLLRGLYQAGNKGYPLPVTEVGAASPREARNAQAVFKVKLNSANESILKSQAHLERNFAQYANTFYGKFLGPAMRFRLNVTRQIYPSGGKIGKEMANAVAGVDANLAVVQGDQLRRNMLFDSKMNELEQAIATRDKYRSYIHQLAPKGAPIEVGRPNTLQQIEESGDDDEYWEQIGELPAATPGSIFTPDHNKLLNRDSPDAHPQYLLKSGGTITGDITVDDGVRVDGVDIGEHHHSGLDGSKKIKGSDIDFSSLPPEVIDTTQKPPVPTSLRVMAHTQRIVPPGVTMIDTQIAWEGDPDLQYEIQVVPYDE